MDPVDGNALAGPFGTLFADDIRDLSGVCAGCGQASLLAQTRVFDHAPGMVARCPGCGDVLATVVEMPEAVRLSLSGFRYVDIPSREP